MCPIQSLHHGVDTATPTIVVLELKLYLRVSYCSVIFQGGSNKWSISYVLYFLCASTKVTFYKKPSFDLLTFAAKIWSMWNNDILVYELFEVCYFEYKTLVCVKFYTPIFSLFLATMATKSVSAASNAQDHNSRHAADLQFFFFFHVES